MRLSLENGYPYPLPDGFDLDTYDSRSHSVLIEDVRHFEWRHTLTIEFDTVEACERVELRISAIVDACFRLIVDGESVLPWRRWGSAQELV